MAAKVDGWQVFDDGGDPYASLRKQQQQQQQMQRTLTKKGAKMNMGELKVSHSKMVGNPSPGLVPWSDH